MSEENVDRLLRVFPSSAPPDLEALLGMLDEDVEWDYVGAFPEARTYHGPDQVRGFLRDWASGFDDFGVAAEELIPAGEQVVFRLRQWGRGKTTGARVESQTWQVLTFRREKIIGCRGYTTKQEALEAAGLSE